MKNIITTLLAFGLTIVQAQKYIVSYSDQAWSSLKVGSLDAADGTILSELKMRILDRGHPDIRSLQGRSGVTLDEDVQIQLDSYSKHSVVQKIPVNWGLDRIDQRKLPLDHLYHYKSTGEDVDAWVIDTGVLEDHQEFEGRATFVANFIDDIDTDCDGHGTHVSSIIGGANIGVAKEVNIKAIKVLDCEGSGLLSGILEAINLVIQQHKKSGRKSIINMSLGAGKDGPLNLAVQYAIKAGVIVVVAAGNEDDDACNYSPASAPGVISVAASAINDSSATFTNFGKCVTLYAPGVRIPGAFIGTGEAEADAIYAVLSGTSMASPHVAGVGALLLANGAVNDHDDFKAYLVKKGTRNVIKGVPRKTPNILLYKGKY